MNKKYQPYLIITILFIVAFIFNFKTINEFPQYKHCWAQCDRYALALGFIDNDGDFFHPQTFAYNNQFPNDFETIKNNTITAVDFPIHDYVVSLLMKLFCTTSPWVFKIYILLYSLIGLFYLYRLTTLFTQSFAKQLIVLLFALSSPTLLYYQAGFLPTIPSLANGFIGLYFFFNYLKTNHVKDFKWSILFITLATLARLPFAIILIAICSFEFLQLLKYKKTSLFKIVTVSLSLLLIGSYYLYNEHLRANYGSLFLNYIIPAANIDELISFIVYTFDHWGFQYFSYFHYALFGVFILTFLYTKIRKKTINNIFESQLILFINILLFGCILYYLLMSFQFLHHDYYFLDTFYSPIILLFLFVVIKAPSFQYSLSKKKLAILVLLGSIPLFVYAYKIQYDQRHLEFYKENTTAINFENAEIFLNEHHIPKDAKILTIAADGVNNPFILMNRKGYTVITPSSDKIKKAIDWPYDYIVLENSKIINQIYTPFPAIINQLIKIGANNNLSIYIKKTKNEPTDFESFFNLDTKLKLYHQRIGFDTVPENCSNTDSLSTFCFSGKKAGFVDALNEYGFTHRITNLKTLYQRKKILNVNAIFYSEKQLNELLLCVSIKSDEKDILFLSNDISKTIVQSQWNKQNILFSLPKIEEKEIEISIFIWNKGRNKVYYDDFDISIY